MGKNNAAVCDISQNLNSKQHIHICLNSTCLKKKDILHILYHPTWKRNWFDIICQHMSNCFQGVYKIQLVNLMRRRILGNEGKMVHRPQRVAGPDRSRLTSYTRLIKDTPMQNKKPIIVHMQWRCYADLAFKLNKMT